MKKKEIGIITTIVIAAIVIATIGIPQGNKMVVPSIPEQLGVSCETTWTIVYNDPTKYDESKIMSILKENLSDDDFRDCVTASQPWTYVSISKPDENGTVKLTLPTASLNSSQKIMKIFSGMEGISLSNRTSGWITDSAHSNP